MSVTIFGVETKKEINLTNHNFREIFRLVNFDIDNISEGQLSECSIEILKEKLEKALKEIESIINFTQDSVKISRYFNSPIVIESVRGTDYFYRRFKELLYLCKTNKTICWY